jgi:hypothetical protein
VQSPPSLPLFFVIRSQSGGNTAAGGDGSCIQQNGNRNECSVVIQREISELEARAEDDRQFRKEALERYSGTNPTGIGPWAFVVVDTADRGLKARNSDLKAGAQIGTAANRSVIWAECANISPFDPEPALGTGGRWLKIKWPNNKQTKEFFNSEPGQTLSAHVFSYYAVPVGHNGKIPEC